MKNIFIISTEQDIDLNQFVSKLNEFGNALEIFPNTFLLSSESVSSRNLYDGITSSDFKSSNMFISILPESENYWGFAGKEVWEWLKNAYNN